jgi:hypothetical protein
MNMHMHMAMNMAMNMIALLCAQCAWSMNACTAHLL